LITQNARKRSQLIVVNVLREHFACKELKQTLIQFYVKAKKIVYSFTLFVYKLRNFKEGVFRAIENKIDGILD